MKFDEVIFYIFVIIFLIVLFGYGFYSIYSIFNTCYKIYIFERDNYSFEQAKLNAKLIDNFTTTRFGSPNYFLVYKFHDSTIRDYNVSSEEYYQVINLK